MTPASGRRGARLSAGMRGPRGDDVTPGSPGLAGLLADRAVDLDGRPGVLSWREDGTPLSVLVFTVVDGRITEIAVVIDPAALALMDLPDPA
ncbi:hypothetical protein [Streptomyces siamensis]|uniref:Uncharacterized protein n=1 Tax=Streptomyces siamensis TaxID=1274986 RepID=A0ABP9J5W7_9ACTN